MLERLFSKTISALMLFPMACYIIHKHMYGWTYRLTGFIVGNDKDRAYRKRIKDCYCH